MNRYMMIHRLRGPAFLLLVGVLALLNQADILSWGKSWPLFLILAGVLQLAERAVVSTSADFPSPPYPGSPNPGAPNQGAPYSGSSYPGSPQPGAPYSEASDPRTSTGVPAYPGKPEAYIAPRQEEIMKDPEGGRS